ncbi:hypothetical protein Ahy_B03g065987 [Arachis hypogaea]|uniref:FAR1 domain-containing protein n=1 Tax=Arachis hypogaea TaxID=3818 RepID=A0A445A2V7_ARAHY|nr:hypothetical protein Ahy_B03g065987 [Arachis hypogaea]
MPLFHRRSPCVLQASPLFEPRCWRVFEHPFSRYHFESGQQTLIEIIIFVCLVPVVVDACVKLWRLEVKESKYYSKESVRAPNPVEGLHVDGKGSDVCEEGSEGFKGHEGFEAESEIHDEFGDGFYDNWVEKAINEIVDLGCMNVKKITAEGFRKERMCHGVEVANQKCEPKPETRCGCEVKMRTHVDKDSGRWIVTYF